LAEFADTLLSPFIPTVESPYNAESGGPAGT
jgi:hypothetical protein